MKRDRQESGEERKGGPFRAVGRWIVRHKRLFAFMLAVTVGGTAALVILTGMSANNDLAGFSMPETVTLAKMDLELAVTATGTLQSANERTVSTSLAYEVAELAVGVGDTVQNGQLLAALDTAELDESIADAYTGIADAEASDALALSQAERKLADAHSARDINSEKNNRAVTDAESALNAAKAAQTTAANAYSTAVTNAKTATDNYNTAKETADTLTDLQTEFTTWETSDENENRALEEFPKHNALKAAEKATAALSDLLTAKEEADSQLPALLSAKEAADTAVSQAEEKLQQAKDARDTAYRSDSLAIENAQDAVDNQKLKDSAEQLRTQLEQYLEQKEACNITAPIAGTVTAVTAEVGQSPAGGAMFTIADLTDLEIPASVPEYDVAGIKAGMAVHITSDAVEDAQWEGRVAGVSPVAADANGNFTVTVEVTSDTDGLTGGMSATLSIVTESKADVYAVPYDAVVTNDAGQSVVYALAGGGFPAGGEMPDGFTFPQDGEMPDGMTGADGERTMPEGSFPAGRTGTADGGGGTSAEQQRTEIAVETGMETDYYIEITGEGLSDGLMILTDPAGNNVQPADDMAAEGGFGMMPGGGMGGGFRG